MEDLIGRTLGHYRIVEKIGEGGMGVVYRAHDKKLDRDVAIKVLPEAVAEDPQRLARFEREAKAVAALDHPNILAIHDFGTDGGITYAVTELLEGESLRECLINAGGPLPWRRVQEIGAAVANGLGATHSKGVVHRDLKPENLFLIDDGRVKILDFGLAQVKVPVEEDAKTATLTPAGTVPGTIMGTVGYMAPEQVRGQPADARSDIFALGCVLYEMLAGHRAFKRDTTAEIMTAILREEPPSLATSGVEVRPEVEKTVERCLEKNPERRFQSARDLGFALGSLTGTSAPVPPVADEPVIVSRRWPLIAATLAAVLVPLAVLLGLLLWRQPPGVDLSGYRFTPFATDAQGEWYPTWSPDGRSIAYMKVVDGTGQIFVRSLNDDFPVQITDLPDGASASTPFWSPDGSRVWFRSPSGVWAVGSAGGEPELVQGGFVQSAAMSPDGRTLATWRVTEGDNGQTGSVWLASPPTAESRRYEPAPFEVEGPYGPVLVRFSPDGAQILAFFSSPEGTQMWLLPLPDGGATRTEPRRIFSDVHPTTVGGFSWMPDSRHVVMAFRETTTSQSKLWMANVRAQTIKPLTTGVMGETTPDVSPDGSRVVFASGSRDYDLVEVPLDGSPIRDLLATSRREHSAAWVPSQNRFVYMTDRSGQDEIRVRSSTEDWNRQIVTAEDFPNDATIRMAGLAVSPDGRLLAFHRRGENGEPAIWLVPTTGGTPTKAVETTGAQYSPVWSPDGRWLAFLLREGGAFNLVKVRVGSSEPPQTMVEGCIDPNFIPSWSPTGEWLVYWCSREPTIGLNLVSPDGQQSRYLAKIGSPLGWVWTRDGTTIYTIDNAPERSQLLAVDAKSGEITIIRDFNSDVLFSTPSWPGIRYTLAPDDSSFSATVARDRFDLWLLEGFNRRKGLLDWFR